VERTIAEPVQRPEGPHAVHFAISNQSLAQPRVTLGIAIDGQSVFVGELEAKGQHNWKELTQSLRSGPHHVEARETNTQTAQQLLLDVKSELWVVVMFTGPPAALSVTSHESPVNFL
jgi:hypothetical protein